MSRDILDASDRRYSYSADGVRKTCEAKYCYKYILGIEKDADASDDAAAFKFGKAFHEVCEHTNHEKRLYTQQMLTKALFDNNVDAEEAPKVYACLMNYFTLHTASRLSCIGIELEISNDWYVGYIDAIMADANGNWWIVDLKTSGLVVEQLFARLHRDTQLNMYAHFAAMVAEKLKIPLEKFAGCRYRVVTKPRTVPKPGEGYEAYASRANVETYDIEVPYELLSTEEAYNDIYEGSLLAKQITLANCKKNRSKCLDWNRPCEYWSQCHGKTYSACLAAAKVFNTKTINDRTKK
jgi:hypothetical protein